MNYFAKLSNKEQRMCYFLLFLACVQFLVGTYDGFVRYSPVPIGDSWDSMIGFIVDGSYKSASGWISQHNEHRIVLTKLLFWLDYTLFNAESWPLIIVNYILAGLAFLLFYSFAKRDFTTEDTTQNGFSKNYIIFLSFIALFSKMQAENFDWEFQSQFFLAFLVPLFSFYLLGKSSLEKENSAGIFTATCIFGILSAGTMANGAFTLPVMVFLGFLLRISCCRIFILTALSIATLSLYLTGYVRPGSHGFISHSLAQPVNVLLFMTSYYGLPFKFLLGKIGCRIFGGLFLYLIARNLWKIFKKEEFNWLNISLFAFTCYVALAGLLSALGRVDLFGVNQAYSGRYSTPVIMAWLGFLVIYKNSLAGLLNKSNRNKYIALTLPLALVINQIDRLDNKKDPDAPFEKIVSILSLEIDAKDIKRVSNRTPGNYGLLYTRYNSIAGRAKIASEENISVFGHPLIKDVKEKIDKKADGRLCKESMGSEIVVEKIAENNEFYRISGNISSGNNTSESFYLTNGRKITGYVIFNANDMAKFRGYNVGGKNIYFYDINNQCRFR